MSFQRNEETQAILGNEYNDDLQQTEKFQRRDVIITRIIYIVVLAIVIGVVAAVVVILVTSYTNVPERKERFVLNSMFNSSLVGARSFIHAWTSSGNTFTFWSGNSSSNCELKIQDASAASSAPTTFISTEVLNQRNIACNSEYSLSYNNRFVAFKTDLVKVFRHSILGRYLVYDTVNKVWLTASPRDKELQKTLLWCSTSARNIAAYVENNNIYLKDFDTMTDTVVTTDGDNEVLFNGVTDWVYEEEVFASVETFVFSPDCSRIAYLKLNDTLVKVYQYEEYGQTEPYPTSIRIRVPVPGTPNPVPSVHVYDMNTARTLTVDIGSNTDIYIYNIQWANQSCLATTRLDRLQHSKQILLSMVTSDPSLLVLLPIAKTITVEQVPNNIGWVQYARESFFVMDGRYLIDVIPSPDNYNLALYDMNDSANIDNNKPSKMLVTGPFDVLHIYPVFNAKTGEIFIASAEQGSTSRHVYAVSLMNAGQRRCISNMTMSTGSTSRTLVKNQGNGFTDVTFSATAEYGILINRGPNVPTTGLISINSASVLQVLEANTVMEQLRNSMDLPSVELATIKSADKKYDLNVMLTKPPQFSEGVQYPVLIYVYGGPGSQLVSSAFANLNRPFNLYVASLGFIVATVDGRGTGPQGFNFLTCTYNNLGTVETEDQFELVNYLKSKAFVNPNAIAIWGWSYGGYMTLMSITSKLNAANGGSTMNALALGMSVAPVTDWRFYDTAYTERFMGLPTSDSNLVGYQTSSVLNRISAESDNTANCTRIIGSNTRTRRTSLLLVHGTGDDNVRPLNSFNLMTRMQTCNIQFDVMFYPNKDHGIPGEASQRHLYRMLSNKLQSTLLGTITDQQQ